MPQAAAAAGAGYGTILFDAAGAGGQQLFQFAEGIARCLLYTSAERHTGFSTQNHIGAGVVAVDENGR